MGLQSQQMALNFLFRLDGLSLEHSPAACVSICLNGIQSSLANMQFA